MESMLRGEGGGLMEVIGLRLGGGISIEWGGCKLYSKGGKGTLTFLRYWIFN